MSELRLYKRGDVYHVRGTIKIPGQKTGIRVRESSGLTRLREAELWRDNLRNQKLEQVLNGPAAEATLSTAIGMYIEKGGEKRFLKPVHERFGATRLRDLSADKISAFALERYGHLAPATVKRELYTPLNAALAVACKGLRVPLVSFDPPTVGRTAVVHAPPEWFPKFFARSHFRIAAAVLFLTATGARVSEMCRLTVEDFYPGRQKALLRKTKNGKPRMVAFDNVMVDAMLALIEQDGLGPKDTIFGYSQRRSVNQAIERICCPVDAKGKPIGEWIDYYSSHKLGRHAFAARLLAEGRSTAQVKEAGGWASIQLVVDTYGHLEENAIHEIVRGKGSEVSGFLRGTQLTHGRFQQKRKMIQKSGNAGDGVVGTRGIEPLTPTMSRASSGEAIDAGNPENKGENGK